MTLNNDEHTTNGKYLDFYLNYKDNGNKFYMVLNEDNEHLGNVELVRVGSWESWVLTSVPHPNIYFSASCQDEVRAFCKHLAGFKRKKDSNFIKSKVQDLRNELYENIPTSEYNVFDMIKVINKHIKKLDEFLDTLK